MKDNTDSNQPFLIRTREFARLLGISPSLVRKWDRLGVIQRHQLGSAVRYSRVDALEIVKRSRKERVG